MGRVDDDIMDELTEEDIGPLDNWGPTLDRSGEPDPFARAFRLPDEVPTYPRVESHPYPRELQEPCGEVPIR